MKACKHYEVLGKETFIEMSNGFPWNAWIVAYENGQVCYSSFATGLFWQYLEHIIESRECRKKVGITKKEVQKLLRKIEEEWQIALQ